MVGSGTAATEHLASLFTHEIVFGAGQLHLFPVVAFPKNPTLQAHFPAIHLT